jgi:hypothetical protein
MYFELYVRIFIRGKFLRLILLDLHRIVGRGGMSGMGGKGGSPRAPKARVHYRKKVN